MERPIHSKKVFILVPKRRGPLCHAAPKRSARFWPRGQRSEGEAKASVLTGVSKEKAVRGRANSSDWLV